MEITDFEKNQSRLQEITKNPQKAIVLQSVIPIEATCQMLKMMRLVLGAPNLQDQIELSQEMLNLLDYIQKNDYFLFLVLMDRFDLIFEVFYKESFLKALKYIKDLQNEKKKNERRYHQHLELLQKKIADLYKKNEEPPNDSYRFNPKTIDAHLDMFNYFFLNYLEITRQFHTKQIETYEEDYRGRIYLIESTIGILQENNMLAEASELSVFLEDYQKAKNVIDQINIMNADGSINDQNLQEKHQRLAHFRSKYASSFKEKLPTYALTRILEISRKVDEHDSKNESILIKNETQYHEKVSKLMPGLDSSISLIKKDISDGMMALKKELSSLDAKSFSEEERKNLHAFIEHLERSEQLIQKIKNPLEIQSAIQKGISDIENFQKDHSMSFLKAGSIQKLEQFKSILVQVNKRVHIKGLILNSNNSLENNENIQRKNENNIIFPEIIHDEKIQNNIQKTKLFHQEIKAVIENNGEKEKSPMIDDEKKSLLDESIESLIIQLNKIKEVSFFEENDFVSSLIGLQRELKNNFCEDAISSLTDKLEDIANNLENFDEVQFEIGKILEHLEELSNPANIASTFKI